MRQAQHSFGLLCIPTAGTEGQKWLAGTDEAGLFKAALLLTNAAGLMMYAGRALLGQMQKWAAAWTQMVCLGWYHKTCWTCPSSSWTFGFEGIREAFRGMTGSFKSVSQTGARPACFVIQSPHNGEKNTLVTKDVGLNTKSRPAGYHLSYWENFDWH